MLGSVCCCENSHIHCSTQKTTRSKRFIKWWLCVALMHNIIFRGTFVLLVIFVLFFVCFCLFVLLACMEPGILFVCLGFSSHAQIKTCPVHSLLSCTQSSSIKWIYWLQFTHFKHNTRHGVPFCVQMTTLTRPEYVLNEESSDDP